MFFNLFTNSLSSKKESNRLREAQGQESAAIRSAKSAKTVEKNKNCIFSREKYFESEIKKVWANRPLQIQRNYSRRPEHGYFAQNKAKTYGAKRAWKHGRMEAWNNGTMEE